VCLGLGRVGPELSSKIRAGLRGGSVEHEVGQQGLETWPVDRRHGCVPQKEREITQEIHMQGWCQGEPPSRPPPNEEC
jgi:hypothetical protein